MEETPPSATVLTEAQWTTLTDTQVPLLALPKHQSTLIAMAKMEAINDIRNAPDEAAENAAWLAFLLFDKFLLHAIGTRGSLNQQLRDRLQMWQRRDLQQLYAE
eukprot:12890782-Prorocentrum_lima.AAC.1